MHYMHACLLFQVPAHRQAHLVRVCVAGGRGPVGRIVRVIVAGAVIVGLVIMVIGVIVIVVIVIVVITIIVSVIIRVAVRVV
jgi:hypothetical protein